MGMSARSIIVAGMSAAVVGAAAVTPVSTPAMSPARIDAAFQMTSITAPLEAAIKNTYNAVQPWVAYGVNWADYLLGFIPVVNWFTPAIPLAYNTFQPLAKGGTYAFADLVGLNFAAIGPDIATGIKTSINNFVTYLLNWANIPLPPRPPLSAASTPAAAARVPAAAAVTGTAASATGAGKAVTGIDTAPTTRTVTIEDKAPTTGAAPKAAAAKAAAASPKTAAATPRAAAATPKAAAADTGTSVKTQRSGRSAG